MKKCITRIIFICIPLLFSIESSMGQEYTIGSEDVLSISFWQEPKFNTTVRVSQNGMIVLPVIGSLTAAGQTPSKLATKIVERISVFNKNISQASVVVTQYGSKKIYVTGHVLQPGKYTFEAIPDLWKIILEAGGPAETALIDHIKIIRGGAEANKIITVNLAEFLKHGDQTKLPRVYPGDTIHVPGIPAETAGADSETSGGIRSTQINEDVIYIYGQIARPGGYRFNQNLSVLEAIIIAGGPTPAAKLDEVKIIMQGAPYSSVATIDLENYSKLGAPAPFSLNPGDTIFIPRRRASSFWESLQRGLLYDVLRIAITASSSILVYRLLR